MISQVPPRKTKAKMNVLYTSQKLHELFFEDKPSSPAPEIANASGDGDNSRRGRCCRLCGGETSLRYFGDTYVWEGVRERYDELLFDCFGVRVTQSDSMICEWCVRALRSTDRFRALVNAAFDQPTTDRGLCICTTSLSSSAVTLKSGSCVKSIKKLSPKPGKEIQKKYNIEPVKRREVKKKAPNDAKAKRINIPCEICKQRYPMLVPNDGYKTFICSRCKKNCELRTSVCRKCNIMMPCNLMKEHLELHAKADLRAKARSRQSKKGPLAFANSVSRDRPQKFQCNKCPKKYAMAKNLALHVRNIHGSSLDNLCSVCGQFLQTRKKLEEHLAEHTGPFQCDECLLIFKKRKGLLSHSQTHDVKCNSN